MEEKFGRLEVVELRSAWAHEAKEFTPWLAENLHRLSDVIGIDLELESVEVQVGPFLADVLAKDRLTGGRILIENQLEQSDHGHLGQILTYLAGLEAKSIIWIARSFRSEHLSAIRWLNQNTMQDISFFAVEISVVRIGESLLAPLFKVLEQPNEWDKEVKLSNPLLNADKPSELAKAFWEETTALNTALSGAVRKGPAGSNLWIKVPKTRFILSLAFSIKEVGWFIRGDINVPDSEIAKEIHIKRECLEKILGVEMKVRDNGWSGFSEWYKCDMRNRENWRSSRDWLMTRMNVVLNAFEKCYQPV
jgi:hypothetical protein